MLQFDNITINHLTLICYSYYIATMSHLIIYYYISYIYIYICACVCIYIYIYM